MMYETTTLLLGILLLFVFARALIHTLVGLCAMAAGVILVVFSYICDCIAWIIRSRRVIHGQIHRAYSGSSNMSVILASGILASAISMSNGDIVTLDHTPTPQVITDIQGRTITGIILQKTDEEILFQRKEDRQEFSIKIDTLSQNDQTLLRSIPNWERNQNPQDQRKADELGENQEEKEEGKPNPFPTVITEDKIFLGLPFETQVRGGICVAAAATNIIRFLEPDIQISQLEFGDLLNRRRSGANYDEIKLAFYHLNYDTEYLPLDSRTRGEIIPRIIESLKNGIPVLAGGKGHMMVLVGYDKTSNHFYLWDQKRTDPSEDPSKPPGTFILAENTLTRRLSTVTFIRPQPKWSDLGEGNQSVLLGIGKHTLERANLQVEERYYLERFRFRNGVPISTDQITSYLQHATEARINLELQRGRSVVIKTEIDEFIQIEQHTDGKSWEVRNLRKNEIVEMTRNQISRVLAQKNGEFFSTKTKAE